MLQNKIKNSSAVCMDTNLILHLVSTVSPVLTLHVLWNNQPQPWNCLNEMEIIFLQQDYLPMQLLSFPAVYLWQKKEIISQLMAEDSEPYCNHYETWLKEIALHIALPWASIILTPGINGWVNGLQKYFNLCQGELRISNGFCFSKCPDRAFPFGLSEKSNYHIISLNGSS